MLKDHVTQLRGSFGDDYAEVRAQTNHEISAILLDGQNITNTRREAGGVCSRVYRGGLFGLSASSDYDGRAAARTFEEARANAAFLDSRVKRGAPRLERTAAGAQTFKYPALREVSQGDILAFLREVDAYIAAKYPGLQSRRVGYNSLAMEKLLCASHGGDSYYLIPRSILHVTLTLVRDGEPFEVFDTFGGFGQFGDYFTALEPYKERIDSMYARLADKAGGVFAEAGFWDVVLDSRLAGILAHEAIGHTVEADLVMGGSVASQYMGKSVASELVTLVDLAHHFGEELCPQPVYIDDEGVEAKDVVIIKDGILRSYMHNRDSARVLGAEPTGNARAYAYSDEPLIRMRNTTILPGESNLDEMIGAVDNGYYMFHTGNGQADLTGEFMFGITGCYEIKRGKLDRAVKDTTISGVAFDMLKTVDMISRDMSWSSSGMCGKKQVMPVGMGGPAIKCKLNVGGR